MVDQKETKNNKIFLFNTLGRKKEEFIPIKKDFDNSSDSVGIYSCGPTVYNFAHIGNLRSYVFSDVLKRTLLLNQFKVNHVINITDVGHLTSDADEGEDKMLKGAKREKKTVWQVAEFYTNAFKNDLQELNILSPNVWSKATDHIKEQIELVKKLEEKGFTYFEGGNVYFDTSKIDDYGEIALLDRNAEQKSRVGHDVNKKNPHDFVLWFTKSKFQDQEMKWDSPWGVGYPGWHIECSAMSMKYLGEQFEIHCGGVDHIPVHHTNEIAQSEACTGNKPWVKYWLHNEFLVLADGNKMAKSGENFLTLSLIKKKGFDALDFRYFCLGTHYRKQLMFSYEALESSKNARKKLNDRVLELKGVSEPGELVSDKSKNYADNFFEYVNDDMNISKALANLWDLLKDSKVENSEKLTLICLFDNVLGLGLKELEEEKVPEEIIKLAEKRLQARKDKDWETSDKLRDEIVSNGYEVSDTAEGFKIKKK